MLKAIPRLLIGPLFNPEVVGQYAQHPNIKIFGQKTFKDKYHYDICYGPEINHFNEILEELPSDWQPDLIIWWDIVFQCLPAGIAECPYPTAVVVGDWNLSLLNIYSSLEAFDYIFSDQALINILNKKGFKNCSYWPQYSFNPDIFHPTPNSEKIYDIAFIGNFNPFIHHQRGEYLQRLAKLSTQYNILIDGDIFGDDYVKVLNQSKIVFNYSVRQEMNLRAYEVTACRSLLFMESHNLEIRNILKDKESCILYDSENFEELIHYYLKYNQKRATIAQKGYDIIQNHSYHHQFTMLLEQASSLINQSPIHKKRPKRPFLNTSNKHQYLSQLQQMLNASSQDAAHMLHRYLFNTQLLEEANLSISLSNALAVILMKTYLQTPEKNSAHSMLKKTHHLLDMHSDSTQPILLYHWGYLHELTEDPEQAIHYYKQSLKNMNVTNLKANFEELKLFIMPNFYCRFMVEWQQISKHKTPRIEDYLRLLTWQVCYKIASIYENLRKWDQALAYYKQSCSSGPQYAESWQNVARIVHYKGELSTALTHYEKASQTQAFALNSWIEIARILLYLKHFKEVIKFTSQWIVILTCNPGTAQYIQQLQSYQTIAQLTLELNQATPSRTRISQLIQYHEEPEFYRLFRNYFKNTQSPLLQELNQELNLHWSPLLPEDTPYISSVMATFNHNEKMLSIHETANPQINQYQRIYHQKSQLSKFQIGPDLWPYTFPTGKKQPPMEMIDKSNFNCLFVLEDAAFQYLNPLLKESIDLIDSHPDSIFIIWKPISPLNDDEISLLEQLLPDEYQDHFIILDAKFTSQEQSSLLQSVNLVLGWPEGPSVYYLWWSLYLKVTALFLQQPLWSYPDVDIEKYHLLKQTNLIQTYSHLEEITIKQHQATIILDDFYKNQAHHIYLRTLWKLKLSYFERISDAIS